MFKPPKVSSKDVSLLARHLSSLQHRIPRASLLNNPWAHDGLASFETAQAFREQHQLTVLDNQQHRDAMRHFVDSLHQIAGTLHSFTPTAQPPLTAAAVLPQVDDDDSEQDAAPETSRVMEQQYQHHMSTDEGKRPSTIKTSDPILREDFKQAEVSGRREEVTLGRAIRRRDIQRAAHLFEQARQREQPLTQDTLVKFFYLAVKTDPFLSYTALRCYHDHPDTMRVNTDMYRRVCEAVGTFDPKNTRRRDIGDFVRTLMKDLDSLDRKCKEDIYPKLVAALATQRTVSVGIYAGRLYQQMVEDDYKMTPGFLKKLLALSKYNRQEDLPFADIMLALAEKKSRPHPFCMISAVHNMFPFTDAQEMCKVLQATHEFQRQMLEDDRSDHVKIFLDMDCLEAISAGAAHAGSSELILLVWDIIEQSNYNPTQTIYENTVIAFAAGEALQPAFGAMASMKEDGFEVSRALIRSFSLAIRSNLHLIDRALQMLIRSTDLVCLETLNVVLSCYAERGDVREVLHVLDTIKSCGIKPDVDSYSFAMEVLGKDINRRSKQDNPAKLQNSIDQADSVLTMMEADDITPSSDVIRNYIELLCIAGETNTATTVVVDCLANDRFSINSKTLYKAAMANAEIGNFEVARELAAHITDDIPILHRKIRSKEQRYRHLQNVNKRGRQTEERFDDFQN